MQQAPILPAFPNHFDGGAVEVDGLGDQGKDPSSLESGALVLPDSVLEQLGLTEPGWSIEIVGAPPPGEGRATPVPTFGMPASGESSAGRTMPVVQEADFDHAVPWSAQDLPWANAVRVEGSLDGDDGIDFYRVPIREGTRALTFDLIVTRPSTSAPERMVVLDGLGQLLDDLPMDPTVGRLHVVLRAVRSVGDGFVYVGVYRLPSPSPDGTPWSDDFSDDSGESPPSSTPVPPTSTDSPPGPTEYAIEVTRQDEGSSSPYGPTQGVPPPPTQLPSGPATQPQPNTTGGGSLSSGGGTPISAVSAPSTATAPVVEVAVDPDRPPRPSPLRSASPAGGSRSFGPSTRAIDRRQAAAIDMALLDLPSDELAEEDLPEECPSPPPRVEEVEIPGGLPLLGAVVPDVRDADQSRHPEAAAVSRSVHTTPTASRSSAGSPKGKESRPVSLRARAAVRCCLGLAYALTFTLLLPDIMAAVQTVEARRNRRPRLRRALLRRFFGPRRG